LGDFDRRLYKHRPRRAVPLARQHHSATVEPAVRRRAARVRMARPPSQFVSSQSGRVDAP
jgi:hypothetical protein